MGRPARARWIDLYPSVTQTSDLGAFRRSRARVLLCNIAADPTWGAYAQRLSWLDTRPIAEAARSMGARILTYIEGFGDCMLYAVALEQREEGVFEMRADDAQVARPVRTHWSWGARGLSHGNAFRWAGPQSVVLGEDFIKPHFTLAAVGVAPPRYPDGRDATGRRPGVRAPLDAELWDACAAKDLNGIVRPVFAPAMGVPAGDDAPAELTEGLYPAIVGKDEIELDASVGVLPAATVVWCGSISVHKDIGAPFWRDYARVSARRIAMAGVDGVWCDNWSPWDNFGYPPITRAFGDWSVHRFRQYLAGEAPRAVVKEADIAQPATLDLPGELKERSRKMGVVEPTNLQERGWRDFRWRDDPLWRLFKAGRQVQARRDLKAFHDALHRGAKEGGRSDFAVCGNDIPFYGLGWAREGWTDMVHTEVTPGWHMGSGTRGIMLPPRGKMAVVYRAALAHQSARFCAAWYYLDHAASAYQRKPGLARLLMAEAFTNGAFLLCDPQQRRVAGTVETHAWWNAFVHDHERDFGLRTPIAEVGLVFSPDCQLWELAPGGFPDMDRQPHVFGHWGWGTALMDAHIPYAVIPDWRLNGAGLRGMRTLIMPDVGCLSDGGMASVVRWVKAGGRLIISGECGIRHGVEGAFQPRARDLAVLLGSTPRSQTARPVGRGLVVSLPDGLGMDYYLRAEARPALLQNMIDAVGLSRLLAAVQAPSTVELALWRRDGSREMDVDLANTDIELDTDSVRPAGLIQVSVQVPWEGPTTARTLSPDGITAARVTGSDRMASVRLDRLVHYASVRLSPAAGS